MGRHANYTRRTVTACLGPVMPLQNRKRLPIDRLKHRAGAARRQIVPNRSQERMTHTEDDSKWRSALGSLDIDAEDDEVIDYSKLLRRESNAEPARQPRAGKAKATADAPADAPRTGRSPPRNRAA